MVALGKIVSWRLALVFALALFACEGKEQATPQGALATWKKAGLDSSGFTKVDGDKLGAGTCKKGTVSGLHVTLCEYDSEEAATKAREAGLAAIGDRTGLSLVKNKMLMVISDDDQVDPTGRTMNRVAKMFWGLEEVDKAPPSE